MSTLDQPRADPFSARPGYALKVAQHALRTAMDETLRPIGVTSPQYAVLAAIEVAPGLSNAELARRAFVTAQSMQGIIANMERDGLLVRRDDPAHGRIRRAEMTAAGRKALARAHAAVSRIEETMLTGLDAARRTAMAQELMRWADNLRTRDEA